MYPELPERSDARLPEAVVGRAAARLGRQVEIALTQVDLTTAQYRALVQLSESAEASSLLAAKLAVSRSSVTTVVDGLVQRGLVDREHSSVDRRRVSLALTEAGRRVLAEADDAVSARLGDILAEVGEPEATLALAGVEQWRAAMDAHRQRRLADKARQQQKTGPPPPETERPKGTLRPEEPASPDVPAWG